MDGLNLDLITIRNFAIAILIGALIGIEREKRRDTEPLIGGLRTFMLMAMLGAIGGWLAAFYQSMLPLLAVLALVSLVVVAGFLMDSAEREGPLGLTTELAAIGVTLLGGFTTMGQPELAVGLAIVTAAVLAYKQPLHGLIGKMGWDDIFAGLRLLIASFIVLPLLPDQPLDPWQALNPRQLWLFVVLISALSMVGYVATRWLGPGRGAIVTGITGGLVSSTATTLAFSRQSRDADGPAIAQSLVSGTLISWVIMFVRMLVISLAVNPALLAPLAPPILAMAGATICIAVALHWRDRRHVATPAEPATELVITTPFSLTQAAKFGALYALILLLVKIVGDLHAGSGLLLVAGLAGLTDVDAITLSMSQYARDGGAAAIAAAAIVIAAIANTILKGGMAAVIGSPRYRRKVLMAMGIIILVGAAAIVLEFAGH